MHKRLPYLRAQVTYLFLIMWSRICKSISLFCVTPTAPDRSFLSHQASSGSHSSGGSTRRRPRYRWYERMKLVRNSKVSLHFNSSFMFHLLSCFGASDFRLTSNQPISSWGTRQDQSCSFLIHLRDARSWESEDKPRRMSLSDGVKRLLIPPQQCFLFLCVFDKESPCVLTEGTKT